MQRDPEPGSQASLSTGGHAGWVGDRLAGADLLQVGGPERALRRWLARNARQRRRAVQGALGLATLACAGIGIWLLAAPTTVTVSMTASTYRVGDAVLHAVAPGVYSGDGALVISRRGGETIAAGSAVVDGKLWVGVCEISIDASRETCKFDDESAVDVWSTGTWHRAFGDGRKVEIESAHGVPVPFPVGLASE